MKLFRVSDNESLTLIVGLDRLVADTHLKWALDQTTVTQGSQKGV